MLFYREKLRANSDQFTKLLNKKQYLPAVEVLMSSINSWNENLDKIEGLRESRTELKVKKEVWFYFYISSPRRKKHMQEI